MPRILNHHEWVRIVNHVIAVTPQRLHSHVVLVARSPEGEPGLVTSEAIARVADLEDGLGVAHHLMADVGGAQARPIVVIFDNPSSTDELSAAIAMRAAMEHCREAVEGSGSPASIALVRHGMLWDVDCVQGDCCPPWGRSLFNGLAADGEGTNPLEHPDARSERAHICGRALLRRFGTSRDGAPVQLSSRGRQHVVDAWRQAVATVASGRPLSASAAGVVRCGLEDIRVRDALLLLHVPGGVSAALAMASGADDDTGVQQALARVVIPECAVAPAKSVTYVLATLSLMAVYGPSAPISALRAFFSWWLDHTTEAVHHVQEALCVDPSYRLAHLIDDAVTAGIGPGWVR